MHSVFRNDSENNWGYTIVTDEVTKDSNDEDCDNQSESDRESRFGYTDYKSLFYLIYTEFTCKFKSWPGYQLS
jgi:hypothetical protein